jgi:Fe-S cluster biogenesis protein NfuA
VSIVGPAGLTDGLVAVEGFLGPDGGSVAVEAWDPETGRLSLRLVLDSADCADCVVPRPTLDTLLLDTLRRHAPVVRAIVLVDPRESSSP